MLRPPPYSPDGEGPSKDTPELLGASLDAGLRRLGARLVLLAPDGAGDVLFFSNLAS